MRRVTWFVVYVLLSACVDPISYRSPKAAQQLAIDGMITDEPGPYTVSLSSTRALDQTSSLSPPVVGAKIAIRSDAGETDILVPVDGQPGAYKSTFIRGVIGRSYSISIELSNGRIYESNPEKLPPPGAVDTIEYEFEPRVVPGIPQHGIFKIYASGKAGSNGENYVRWRLFGTYRVENFPQYRTIRGDNNNILPAPEPCSGYISFNGLKYVRPCTCCVCWVSEYGTPVVTDTRLASGGAINKVRVGTVNVNRRTFFDKYHVEVQMMSLTQDAYNFWKTIEVQREGASSLFQPPLAQVKSNIYNKEDLSETVQGYFGASAISRKSIFLTRDAVPLYMLPIDTITSSCIGTNSTTTQPAFWK